MSKKQSNNYLAQAWLVLLLAILYGGGLAFVNSTLSPRIEENKKNERYSVIPSLLGNPETYNSPIEVVITTASGETKTIYKLETPDGSGIGWAIPSSAIGFADNISVMVGVDYQCSQILGMRVMEQKETPGLGNLIVEPSFSNQFIGKSTNDEVEVVKTTPGKLSEIVAVTGATISSKTVALAVNSAINQVKPEIEKLIQQADS